MWSKTVRIALAALFLLTPVLLGQATYSTSFEQPEFPLGNIDGLNGWGHISNSPTDGIVEAVPPGTPAELGAQCLALRTRDTGMFGVTNHLYSQIIDPAAGETGSTVGAAAVVSAQSTFQASLWYRTPPPAPISYKPDGRIAELDPSTKGSAPGDVANRYAEVRILNSTNTAQGVPLVEVRWPLANGDLGATTVATLAWDTWYRFEYTIHVSDGLNGIESNDAFKFTAYDAQGNVLGTACAFTWEVGYRTGGWGGSATPRGINGFDFWSLGIPNGSLAGYVDGLTFSTSTSTPLEATITGPAYTCGGSTALLTAGYTGGLGPVTSYAWRDSGGTLVGTDPTLNADPGTYTVTVENAFCESATSAPFVLQWGFFEALEAAVTGNPYVCYGGTTVLNAAASGGSGDLTAFEWRDARNNVVGTGSTLIAGAGTYTVTVIDSACGAATSNPITVQVSCKATPVVTWNDPADITYGTSLDATQLNAAADVPGGFTYVPPAGTLLHAGAGQLLTTDFTPADSANYNAVSGTAVHINVNKRPTAISITGVSPSPSRAGQTVVVTFSLSGLWPGAGGGVTISDGADTCATAPQSDTCTMTVATAGIRSLTATYSGDGDHFGSTSAAYLQSVEGAVPTARLDGSVTICRGSPAALRVILTGEPPWSITWSDGTSETTSDAVHMRTVSPSVTTLYTLAAVSDSRGEGTVSGSTTVIVTVVDPPLITGPATVSIGEPATLHATSGYSSYQWYFSGSPIAGATWPDFAIPSVSIADLGEYTVTGARDGCVSAASTPFAVRVEGLPAGLDAVIPIVGNLPGSAGSLYRTTLHIVNGSDDAIDGEISFIDSSVPHYAFHLAPRETRFAGDLLPPWFSGLTSADVHMNDGPLPIIVAHVFNDGGPAGTFGLIERAIPVASTLATGDTAVLFTPSDSRAMRMNVGLRSLSSGFRFRLTRRDAEGYTLQTMEKELLPSTFVQEPLEALLGVFAGANESLTFEILSGRGVVYGAAADNGTNDPSLQIAAKTGVTSSRFVLPVAGSTHGQFGSFFATGLQIHNPMSGVLQALLTFHPAGSGAEKTREIFVEPGATIGMDDVVEAIIPGVGVSGLGSLDVTMTPAASPVLLGRVYSVAGYGQTSLMTELVPQERFLVAGDSAIVAAPHSPQSLRFNLGVRTFDSNVRIRATIRSADGSVLKSASLSFSPGSFVQDSAPAVLDFTFMGDESITFDVDSGTVVIYAVWTDNISQDPAMQRAVRPSSGE